MEKVAWDAKKTLRNMVLPLAMLPGAMGQGVPPQPEQPTQDLYITHVEKPENAKKIQKKLDEEYMHQLHDQRQENDPRLRVNRASKTGATRMEKLLARTTLPEMEREHPGAVCGDCGRTVTEGEYSFGGSNCCKADVVPEEEYGMSVQASATDDGEIIQKACPSCGHVPVYKESKKAAAPHVYYCHSCNRGFDEFKKEGAKPRAPEQERYQDSAAGAIQMLRDYADTKQVKLDGATARPDPQVQGVWEVKMKNGDRAIVYLAGYREPMGNIRATNDFEMETQDDRDFAAEQRKNRPDPYGVRTSALGDKRSDPHTDRWMMEYLESPQDEPFPQLEKRKQIPTPSRPKQGRLKLNAKLLKKAEGKTAGAQEFSVRAEGKTAEEASVVYVFGREN